jgi:hypothetical protein
MIDNDLKNQVRAELFRCAITGQFQTYAQFSIASVPEERWADFHTKHILT